MAAVESTMGKLEATTIPAKSKWDVPVDTTQKTAQMGLGRKLTAATDDLKICSPRETLPYPRECRQPGVNPAELLEASFFWKAVSMKRECKVHDVPAGLWS
ncbi:hypothetical protein JRQ81_018414 [Phrynocephalus forsythii]|uniref:Uncharacterized protein n=1 Tax=Phrynocephalus forsythii TaxID=171643 RepID=A0A9Q1AZK8_9SAUR|nr:hypothetical protein JRQ81_018414 [Phrynocephalus forsythii]